MAEYCIEKLGVSAVLLAAGESRRMGRLNKLELELGGISLLRRSVQTLLDSSLEEIIVVVGYQQNKIRRLLAGLPVSVIYNKHYQQGQMTSVQVGLKALSKDMMGVMICLTDQPLLDKVDINRLIDAFGQGDDGSILVPTYNGKRGNPIVLAQHPIREILKGERNLGCKHLIDRNPELVSIVEMANDHVISDMDLPEEYAALKILFDRA